jgi:predicted nucleic acid-binding protein
MATPVVLDTSVILNLIASGHAENMLQSLQAKCLVSTAAAQEVIYIRADDPREPVHAVSIDPWIGANLIVLVSAEGRNEEDLYVRFASELDDGEAMSLAICHSRGYILATDDRKARRLAGSLKPVAAAVLTTAEIVHRWATLTDVKADLLSDTISTVERRARFLPPQGDPFREWWLSKR